MSTAGWIILALANMPLYWVVGWIVFKDWGDFWECVKFWLTPDIISLFRGEWIEDWWAEMKLFVWIALCGAAVLGESIALAKWLQ
jgi:hypothetical protein